MKETTKQILSSKLMPKDIPEDFVLNEFRRAYAYGYTEPISNSHPESALVSFERWMESTGECSDGKIMCHDKCMRRKYKKKIDYDTSPKPKKKAKRRKKQNKNQKSITEIIYG